MASLDLPLWMSAKAPIDHDPYCESLSSELQIETAEECLPLLRGNGKMVEVGRCGMPRLMRKKHVKFLSYMLGRLPLGFTGLDASRPWMFYWCLMAMDQLGEDVSTMREELISTLKPIQNITGGFGGGPGQYSHLATTYASVLALATVGGTEAYNLIDRKAMWHWLGRLKLREGHFLVTEGGENDVRGAFCAMVMVSLLCLPVELPESSPARVTGDETFMTGLAEWISRCQTYEGGLGSVPGAEAHGAYTFCALACLCILGDPRKMFRKYLDLPSLISWLAARQHAPEGGLGGRSNKLVDGCYSHWIGGCWSLVAAACRHEGSTPELFNREGLIRYILCCCQSERGGLRDKPSKPPDAYHTLYCLVGLNSAQNQYDYIDATGPSVDPAFQWHASAQTDSSDAGAVVDPADRLPFLHPIFIIPFDAARAMREHFNSKPTWD